MNSPDVVAQNRPRILLVDDDLDVLHVLEAQLEPYCDCVAVNEPRLALENLAHQEFDVIVSDQVMPYMSGDQLFAQAVKSWPEMERVMVTGYADMSSVISAVNFGKISHYLAKPWQDGELAQAVLAACSRRQATRQQKDDYEKARAERLQAVAALAEGWDFLKQVSRSRKSGRAGHLIRSISGEPALVEFIPD